MSVQGRGPELIVAIGIAGSWSGSREESGGGSVRVTETADGSESLRLKGTGPEAESSSSAEVEWSIRRPSGVTMLGAVMTS